MITPKLFFGINFEFDLTLNEQLKNLSALKIWDTGLQKYLYIFPMNMLNDIIALTGKQIDFDGEKKEIMNVINHSHSLKKEITTENYKGDGFVYVQRFPKIFRIKTIMRKQEYTFEIPVETVKATWEVIKKYELNVLIKSKKIAEDWCNMLGITRFHRQTGSFDGDKMYGTREIYFQFYYSLKVLQDYGVIEYSKTGFVKRIKDSFELGGNIGVDSE